MLFFPLAVNKEVLITAFDKILHGHLDTPEVADRREDGGEWIIFAHGSGSRQHSERLTDLSQLN